jgi:para-nitrobenzyl esterase
MRAEMGNAVAGLAGGVIRDTTNTRTPAPRPAAPRGAVHSAEIEYALGNLPKNRVYDWQPEDYKVFEIMQSYFANFIKTGNPNGLGVPAWRAVSNKIVEVMHIDANTKVQPEKNRQHYLFLDGLTGK